MGKEIIYILLFLLSSISIYSQGPEKFLKWQDKPLIGVLFNPDGTQLASVGSDKTIKIWDVKDGRLINTLYDNVSGEVAIAYSPDGSKIVSGSWDQDVKIWDPVKGEVLLRLKGHDKSLRAVTYDPSGNFIASAGWDKDILIWYAPSGLLLKRLKGNTQCVRAIEYSPDGHYIASGGYDLFLRVFDVKTGNLIYEKKGHKYPIEALSYSPDGAYIATGGNDNNIKIWNASNGTIVKTLIGHTDGVYTVQFSPDGRYLASGGNDNSIKIWDVEKGTNIITFNGHTLTVKSVSFSPDGKLLVSTGADKTIRIWDISQLNIVPLSKIKVSYQGISANDNEIDVDKSLTNMEVFDRPFKIRYLVNNNELSNFRLFHNKKEFVKFNGFDTIVVQPDIKVVNSTQKELLYDVYLKYGANEFQLSAESEKNKTISFSSPVTIKCTDYDAIASSSSLNVINISPNQYADKKLAKEFVECQSNVLIDTLKNLKERLFKNVHLYNITEISEISADSIQLIIDRVKSKFQKNDFVVFLINAPIFSDGASIFMLAPGSEIKSPVKIELASLISNKFSTNKQIIVLVNNNLSFTKFPEEYTVPPTEDVIKYISDKIAKNYTNYAIISSQNSASNNPFKVIASGYSLNQDSNHNNAVDFKEFIQYLSQISNFSFISKGYIYPLCIE